MFAHHCRKHTGLETPAPLWTAVCLSGGWVCTMCRCHLHALHNIQVRTALCVRQREQSPSTPQCPGKARCVCVCVCVCVNCKHSIISKWRRVCVGGGGYPLKLRERGRTRWSSLKGWERAIVNQTHIETVLKAPVGKLQRDGVRISEYIDTILNWTGIGSMFQVDCRLHFPPRRAYGLCVIIWVWVVRSCWGWKTSNSPGLQIFRRYRYMLCVSFRCLESLLNSWGFCL